MAPSGRPDGMSRRRLVRFPEGLDQAMRRAAGARHIGVSALIRLAVSEYLANQGFLLPSDVTDNGDPDSVGDDGAEDAR